MEKKKKKWTEDDWIQDREEARAAVADALIALDWKTWDFECLCGACGPNYDDGKDMIQCARCLKWAHDDCVVARLKGQRKMGALRLQRYQCISCAPHRYSTAAIQSVTPLEWPGTKIMKPDKYLAVRIRNAESYRDKSIVKEVAEDGCYERPIFSFELTPGDKWLDIGAHIGVFSSLALVSGADVVSVEPFPSNFALLQDNVHRHAVENATHGITIQAAVLPEKKTVTTPLFLHPKGTAFRHSAHPSRAFKWQDRIDVPVVTLSELLEKFNDVNAVKVDIQGSERDIIDSVSNWGRVTKLVFEYDFEYAPSLLQFHAFIARLRAHFEYVWHPKIKRKTGLFVGFPNGVLVFALRTVDKSFKDAVLPESIREQCDRRSDQEWDHVNRVVRQQVTKALTSIMDTAFPSDEIHAPAPAHDDDDDDVEESHDNDDDDDDADRHYCNYDDDDDDDPADETST